MDPKSVKRLGFFMLPTDVTGPAEIGNVLKLFPNLVFQTTNLRFPKGSNELTTENYEFALKHLPESADLLRPTNAFTFAGVSCTSFSFAVGADRVTASIASALQLPSSNNVLNMASSLYKGIQTMGFKRVCVLTPYVQELNDILEKQLVQTGLDVVAMKGLAKTNDFDIYCVPPSLLKEEAVKLVKSVEGKIDGLVISCSALRVLNHGFIDELEGATGVPVVTSMQAFTWDMIRTSGETTKIDGFGSIFRL